MTIEFLNHSLNHQNHNLFFKNPDFIFDYFYTFTFLSNEIIQMVLLDKDCRLLKHQTVAWGTNQSVSFTLRDIFAFAIKCSAYQFILIHNHPSGNSYPSEHDLYLTKKINQVAKQLNFIFLDHLIITKKSYFSFNKNKLL